MIQQSCRHQAARPPSVCRLHPGRRHHVTARRLRPAPALPPVVTDLLAAAQSAHPGLAAGCAVTTAVFVGGIQVLLRGLTWPGVATSWVLGSLVYAAFGPGGFALVCLYFLFGSAVTKLKLEQKQKEGIAEQRSGRRGPGSVFGSGTAGLLCAAASLATGAAAPWQAAFVASFTSKLSDTVSSEVGKAYGQTTYLVTTFARVPRGTEGAVSLEGTLAGVGAAFAYAAVALALGQVTGVQAGIAAAAAIAANLFESYLGAAVQGRVEWLTNDLVNVIQICLAAALAAAAQQLLPAAAG